jgi:hypothetical protein
MADDFGFVPHSAANTPPPQSGTGGAGDDFGFIPHTPTLGEAAGSTAQSFGGEMLHNLNPINVAEGAYNLVRHPIDAVNADSAARDAEMGKSVDAFNKGNYLEGATRYLTGAIPVLGPMAGKAYDAINSGDTQQGGKALADITSLWAVPEAYKGVGGLGVSKPIIKSLSDWWGKATGAGGEALRTGANAVTPAARKAYMDALRNKTSETQIVNDLKGALNNVTTKRASDYKSAVGKLNQGIQTDIAPAQKNFVNQMLNYGIGVKRGTGALDFSRSTLTNAGDRKLVVNLSKDLQGWRDLSPNSMDTLKQRVYSYANDASPQAAPLFYRVGEQIKNELESKVPGYKELTGDYAKASDLIKQVQSELSTNNQNPGVTIRKLSNALNQNNDYRRVLLEALDHAAGSHLKESIAGNSMKGFVPRGIQGTMASTPLALGLYLHNPELMGAAAFSSPRVAGEMMGAISALKRSGAGTALKGAGTVGGAAAKASMVNPNRDRIGLPPPPANQ